MPREPLFTFIPLEKRERLKDKKEKAKMHDPFVKIAKSGLLTIPASCIEQLGLEFKDRFVQLFYDEGKRALAWKFTDTMSETTRFLKMRANKTRYGEYKYYSLSVGNFVKLLSRPLLPTPRLTIKKYDDKDEYIQLGEMFYVIVPQEERRKDEKVDNQGQGYES